MRYDKDIYFQTVKSEYDAATGDYTNTEVAEVHKLASVTDSGVETMNLIYGKLKQGSKTVRLLNRYNEPFDHIRIGRKIYNVDFSRELTTKHVFVVSEVQ